MGKNFSISRRAFIGLLPFLSASSGYIAGTIIFIAVGFSGSDEIFLPDLTSVFSHSKPLKDFLGIYFNEIKYTLLIFLCAFGKASHATASSVLFVRAVCHGFSVVYLWGLSPKGEVYLIHALSSALTLVLSAFVCRRAIDFSNFGDVAYNGLSDRRKILAYMLEFLYIGGLLLLVIFTRQILLLLI